MSAKFCNRMNEFSVRNQIFVVCLKIQQPPAFPRKNIPRINYFRFFGSMIEWETFHQLFETFIENILVFQISKK